MGRTVGELIERDAVLTAGPAMTVAEAARRMAQAACGSILIVRGDDLVGIFTERDLLVRVVGAGRDPAAVVLEEVMTRAPDTIPVEAPVGEAVRRMDAFSYRYLPVLEGARVVGVISLRQLPFSGVLAMQDELGARHAIAERLR
jgi:CBS domain-containing protein